MSGVLEQVRGYLAGLEQRERRTLIAGAVAVLAAVLYVGVYEPLYPGTDALAERLADRRDTLQAVRRIAPTLGVSTERIGQGRDGSLLARIDGAANRSGLAGAIRRMQPDGDAVRVSLSGAEFDRLVEWLGRLRSEHAIVVTGLSLEPADAAGRVDGSVNLGPPA